MSYLMWFDNSNSEMSEKARKAVEYYQSKFGTPPQVLEMSVKDEPLPEGLELVVRVRRVSIPKFHFLMGSDGLDFE